MQFRNFSQHLFFTCLSQGNFYIIFDVPEEIFSQFCNVTFDLLAIVQFKDELWIMSYGI